MRLWIESRNERDDMAVTFTYTKENFYESTTFMDHIANKVANDLAESIAKDIREDVVKSLDLEAIQKEVSIKIAAEVARQVAERMPETSTSNNDLGGSEAPLSEGGSIK